MAHDLETQSDGTVSFVAARKPAWHKLGTVYADRSGLTLDEILTDLNVGTLIEEPVFAGISGKPLPGKKAITRRRGYDALTETWDDTPLGIVGDDYTVIDERTAFGFLEVVAETGEASWQTAMLLKNGARAAACMKLSDGILIGGVDPVDLFLLICTSHDGSLALTATATPVRVVCQNTLTWALQSAAQKWTIRHTKHATQAMSVEEARRTLDLTYAYVGAWAQEAEDLLETEMTKLQFEQIVAHLYAPRGDNPAKATKTIWENTHDQLMQLWAAPTQSDISGSAWAGLNALTEYTDWYRGVREPGDDEAAYRFGRALAEGASAEKNKIHETIRQFAGI